MATKVIERMRACEGCAKTTLQRKNSKEMSWLLHLFLAIITGGIWILIWLVMLIWHTFNKSATAVISRWVCSECGTKN
jgi:CHASE3 domain sensor protein